MEQKSARRPKILVIDDEIGDTNSVLHRAFLHSVGALDRHGRPIVDFPYEFHFCTGCKPDGEYSLEAIIECVEQGWNSISQNFWGLVLVDVVFGKYRALGYEVLKRIRHTHDLGNDLPVVMLTAERQTKQDAAHGGANGFLPKVTDEGRLALTREALDKVIFREGLVEDIRPAIPDERYRVIGRSLPLLKTLREIRRMAKDGPIRQVCLLGESGSGKELIARYAHGIANSDASFISKTADPGNPAIELSDIFGCWPGAHSQAPRQGTGMVSAFELAHGGTLFLDEVANLSIESQRRLLEARTTGGQRTRSINRYGTPPLNDRPTLQRCLPQIRGRFDEKTGRISVDVTMVTATNVRLNDPAQLNERKFLPDLWQGIQPYVTLPNLNVRSGDAALLFTHMLRVNLGRENVNIHKDVLSALNSVDWSEHGNVRGVERAVESTALRYDDFEIVTMSQLPTDLFERRLSSASGTGMVHQKREARSIPEVQEVPFSQLLLNRYRADLELLAKELEKTVDKTRLTGKGLVPARALCNLLERKVSGADISRLIQKLFFAPVFSPPRALKECLDKVGLGELQTWVRSHPFLAEFVNDIQDDQGN